MLCLEWAVGEDVLSVDIPEFAEEEGAEFNERACLFGRCWATGAHRGQLFQEVEEVVADDPKGNHFGLSFVLRLNMPTENARIEGVGGRPQVDARTFLD